MVPESGLASLAGENHPFIGEGAARVEPIKLTVEMNKP
jgi:hypothetical protein